MRLCVSLAAVVSYKLTAELFQSGVFVGVLDLCILAVPSRVHRLQQLACGFKIEARFVGRWLTVHSMGLFNQMKLSTVKYYFTWKELHMLILSHTMKGTSRSIFAHSFIFLSRPL